jgi:hypothetical protein
MSGRLIWLGRGDSLVAVELASSLCCLTLGVGLLSAGLYSLVLPKGMPSLRREPGVRPQCDGLWWIRPWCGCDEIMRCAHATPLGDGEAEAPLSTRFHVELIGKVLENECNYGDLL